MIAVNSLLGTFGYCYCQRESLIAGAYFSQTSAIRFCLCPFLERWLSLIQDEAKFQARFSHLRTCNSGLQSVVESLLRDTVLITQNVTLSNAQECRYKTEQNFNPGLKLIGLSGTGPWYLAAVHVIGVSARRELTVFVENELFFCS